MKKLSILFILLWSSVSFASWSSYFREGMRAENNFHYFSAIKMYKQDCNLGHKEGCERLKDLYELYLDVEAKPNEVKTTPLTEMFRKSCNKGYALRCNDLGKLYEEKSKYSKAAESYRKSCKMGNADGCWILGVLYKEGKGVKQNNAKAQKLFRKACSMGLNALNCRDYR